MTRTAALAAIKAAGAAGDQKALMRLYIENRISYAVAMKAYREGATFARFVATRDAKDGA